MTGNGTDANLGLRGGTEGSDANKSLAFPQR